DLRVALDPAGDQSFYFSAARCNPVGLNLGGAIGVTPQKAGLWIGMTQEWTEFLSTVTRLLKHLAIKRAPLKAPLPILASEDVNKNDVKDAFDATFQPPQLDDPTIDLSEKQKAEDYAQHTNFEI